ncbi:DUF1934 domain-containing protein [Paenibacillus pabuli]|uniref:DUF1934 domain-containing protein n=1 Tax=Paenibacillus pabuli TaxID=1472 RepID=UPI003CF00636
MSNMRPVQIRLHSRYEGEDVLQEMQGEAVLKGSVLYVRYEEPQTGPEGGITRTTLKLGGQSIKIIRHGEVESEQTFELHRKLPGFYRSPYMSFALSTHTQELELSIQGLSARAAWSYDFYRFDEESGHFAISLHIQEEPIS